MNLKQLLTMTVDLQSPFNNKGQPPLYARDGSHLILQLTMLRKERQRQCDARNFVTFMRFSIQTTFSKVFWMGLAAYCFQLAHVSTKLIAYNETRCNLHQ